MRSAGENGCAGAWLLMDCDSFESEFAQLGIFAQLNFYIYTRNGKVKSWGETTKRNFLLAKTSLGGKTETVFIGAQYNRYAYVVNAR